MHDFRLWLVLALSLTTTAASAEDAPSATSSPKLDYLVGRWKDVTIEPKATGTPPYQFQSAPVMQWQNPISGADGAVFVWTSAGRPVVLCKCHVNDIKRHYVSSSVSLTTDLFTMKLGDRTLWSPQEPGITWRTIDNIATPADR